MNFIRIALLLLNIAIATSAFASSFATTGNGFQVTTCTGPCCSGNGGCVITVPQACTGSAGAWQGSFFGNCNTTTCPPATVITILPGCTIYNATAGTITTWWGYRNIANVPIFIPEGVFDEIENMFSDRILTPPTTFYPYVEY